MPEANVFQLERLYFGTLVTEDGRVSPAPGVIARTGGITPAHVAECLRAARLAPPLPGDTSPEMPGAFGLFRGESVDAILAKAQRNDAGYPQLMFILVPQAALLALEGNLLAFRSLAQMDMPAFTAIRRDLVPFELRNPAPLSAAAQADLLLELLLTAQDSFKTIEGLLSALIEGQPLAITNCPRSVEQRLRFVQGLLTLLPVPARIGVTFATYVNAPQASPAQIKFLNGYSVPENHVVFDWGNAALLTDAPTHPYSAYILRQLRLDPSLVVEQTQEMARTTVWRAHHRESLSTALAWVSRRAAVDRTLQQGQPVDRKLAAAILREDPTLPDDLRQIYARHLLAMALAVGDLPATDVIPTIAVSSEGVAAAVSGQLERAIEEGQADTVFALVQRWILGVPDTSATQWHAGLRSAAKARLRALLAADDPADAIAFLNNVRDPHPVLGLGPVIPELIDEARRASHHKPALAPAVFLLAAQTQPPGEFQRLLADRAFIAHLPEATRATVEYLQERTPQPPLPHLLDYGARALGEANSRMVMARFIEWALLLRRTSLIDTQALSVLLDAAQGDQGERYATLIQHVVDDLSHPAVVAGLEPPGPRLLVDLLLQIGSYRQAIELLEMYQNAVFRVERFEEFTRLASEVFARARLAPERLAEALTYLEGSQIRPEPRTAMFCGALINRGWAADQDYAAQRLTTMLFNDNHLIEVIGRDNAVRLLAYHGAKRDAIDALRVGAALIDHILTTGDNGAALVAQIWEHITWDASVSEAALELLRRYVRGVRLEQVPTLLAYFSEKLGAEVGRALHATWLMRLAMNSTGLMRFAEAIHITARLLIDLASTYHADKELPPNHRVRRDLDQMTGSLSENERERLAQNLLVILEQVYELGQATARRRAKSPPPDALVAGKATPQTGLELLRFIGGQFSDHAAIPLELEREAMAHLFGTRSAAMFLRETDAIVRLLDGLQTAYRSPRATDVTAEALRSELESLWGTLSLYNQRRIQAEFAADCQHLAEVVALITNQANDRVLTSHGLIHQLESGQRQPRSALEALRWIHGYFARKHTRMRA